jgi:hypothetical protein
MIFFTGIKGKPIGVISLIESLYVIINKYIISFIYSHLKIDINVNFNFTLLRLIYITK